MIDTAGLLENNSKYSFEKQIYGGISMPHFPCNMWKVFVPPDIESRYDNFLKPNLPKWRKAYEPFVIDWEEELQTSSLHLLRESRFDTLTKIYSEILEDIWSPQNLSIHFQPLCMLSVFSFHTFVFTFMIVDYLWLMHNLFTNIYIKLLTWTTLSDVFWKHYHQGT